MTPQILLVLLLVAGCACQIAPTATQTAPGIMTVTHEVGLISTNSRNSLIGTKFATADTFAKFVWACTTSGGLACSAFTCTSASACAAASGVTGITPTQGTAGTFNYPRTMATYDATNDKGFVLGDNAIFWKAVAQAAPAAGNVTAVDTAATITLAVFNGAPTGLTMTMNQVAPDVVLMTFTSTSINTQYSVGWKEGTNTWPTWAASCSVKATSSPFCVFINCSAFDTCTAATGATLYDGVALSQTAASNTVVVSRNAVGPSAFTIASGAQSNMLFYHGSIGNNAAATVAAASGNGWSTFATNPTVTKAFPVDPVFPFALTATTDAANVALTMTTNASKYGAVGWQKAGAPYPSYAVVCDPSQSASQCKQFDCTAWATCTESTAAGFSFTSTAATRVAVVTRAIAPATPSGAHTIVLGTQNLLLAEGTAGAVAASMAQSQDWKFLTRELAAFQGTKPTFNVSAAQATADTVALSVTTNANKYAMTGVNNGVANFPSFLTICEPATQQNCGIYTCTAAATCADSTVTGVTQTRDQTNRVATVTFPKTQLPATGNSYLYWVEKDVPTPFTISNSLGQSQTWATYLLAVGPVSSNPTFNVTFSRPSDTTIVTTLVPGDKKTVFFGWRMSAAALYPTDALICAPSVTAIGKCLDAQCTSAAACTARATSIYTANTATGTTATVTRTLTAGDVKLAANTKMWLAWDLIDTPASTTTTLNASDLQSRSTWKFYEAAIPATGTTNSAAAITPCLGAALLALLFVLA